MASSKPSGTPPRQANRKPSTSIVNQKQRPWGIIVTTVVVALFAIGIVAFALTRGSGSSSTAAGGGMSKNPADKPYEQPALPAAMKINGVTYKVEIHHSHVNGTVKYDSTPPVGGDHSQYWANCTGTVYDHQIANENAVHMLEHGAVWITYNPKTISAADLTTLKNIVDGQDRLALSPYADLKTPISLQAWNYQLFVDHASDPRIDAFIQALKNNPKTTPELGASCSDPQFNAADSYPGHPQV